jgi:hypothetical protein
MATANPMFRRSKRIGSEPGAGLLVGLPRHQTPSDRVTRHRSIENQHIMKTANSILGTLCVATACLLLGACGTKPFDPDCTAEKAARSTAMKAAVGVGGRGTPKEAIADTIERNRGSE